MKKVLLSILGTTALVLSAHATIHTVSNNVNSPGQFNNLQTAIDAAANNDTLYIHRSDVSYGSVTLKKTLTFIGEGSMPEKQLQLTTSNGILIDAISLTYADFPATTTASGSKFLGLNINQIYIQSASSSSTSGIGSLTFSRNKIGNVYLSGVSHSNLLFYQNVISSIGQACGSCGPIYNSIISNNIITAIQPITTQGANNLISNNIIGSTFSARNAIVSNNIFYNFVSSGTLSISTVSCTFSNNIFYAATAVSESSIISGSNTGSGNFFNVDPQFVTPATPSMVQQYSYSTPATGPYANLHLQATSVGINAGTDGTEIGIYGGNYAWQDGSSTDSRFRYYPMNNVVPQIIEMNITNPTIPQNGTLNVNFNAKSVH